MENEQKIFTEAMQGIFMNLMDGKYIINPLELRLFSNNPDDTEDAKPNYNYLISYCKNFFKVYKPKLEHYHIDVLEIMLNKLFGKFDIDENTDFSRLKATDYPILSDLHNVLNAEYEAYNQMEYPIYKAETLQELNLSLRSICVGNDSRYFNGHTNIDSDMFITFGVKEAMTANEELKNLMLFNALSYMADATLTAGNTFAVIDELHGFLTNPVALDYIRNNIKRNRKRNSGMIIA
ncbi:MAG: type VI secretion protein, partial [Clostridiales bacterium]|nr:type VI secretion protein [Clostridiales bacterium]